MGDLPHHDGVGTEPVGLERRQFLGRVAVVGAFWAVPTIVTMKPASAAGLHSSPPPVDPPPGKPVKQLGAGIDPVSTSPRTRTRTQGRTGPGELPFTGAPIEQLTAAGLAVTAAGAAMMLMAADADGAQAATLDSAPE